MSSYPKWIDATSGEQGRPTFHGSFQDEPAHQVFVSDFIDNAPEVMSEMQFNEFMSRYMREAKRQVVHRVLLALNAADDGTVFVNLYRGADNVSSISDRVFHGSCGVSITTPTCSVDGEGDTWESATSAALGKLREKEARGLDRLLQDIEAA